MNESEVKNKNGRKTKVLTSSASGFQYSVTDGMRTRSESVKASCSSNANEMWVPQETSKTVWPEKR